MDRDPLARRPAQWQAGVYFPLLILGKWINPPLNFPSGLRKALGLRQESWIMAYKKNPFLALASALALFLALGLSGNASADTEYEDWGQVASAMKETFDQAIDYYGKGQADEAYGKIDDAYFQFYEKEGFERNVKGRISGKRVSAVEYKFVIIKQNIRKGEPFDKVKADIDTLSAWCLEDAQKLDAKVAAQRVAQAVAGPDQAAPAPVAPETAPAPTGLDWDTFFYSFGTLVREGVEAILVIAAIAAYLLRMGQKRGVAVVYWAAVAAVLASALAAVALQRLINLSGANQEIIEGGTMLLATVVLFCVSNWMFAKAEAEAWKQYIASKVERAISTGSVFTLAAASFLAVFREGAETILFYQSILNQAGPDKTMVWVGFAAGAAILVAVFLIIRHGTMRLPLKPFFIATSILMFIMSIVFVGGGVKELQEGNAIPVTMIPGFPTIELLKVYPTVQTFVPQLLLLALAIGSVAFIHSRNRKALAEQRAA
ncbi:MAG: FTR1 family iron permease [Deltaproteobacteria bacterium]|jgi:high-affinity iron transporter|nr:FTR1 family iron permease [Deltaproteobacteria bacterium]